ncbi:hypothetical protein EJB05_07332 [Eragrostis curvula]|uniref:Uncharacterized protein n=1 Tax=Eragrostis curvula TaxID=38414 RepID=A0A5J9WI34_9POAL|nr:hypothetical protein EJB05_07332 [Eragrostis curvula]
MKTADVKMEALTMCNSVDWLPDDNSFRPPLPSGVSRRSLTLKRSKQQAKNPSRVGCFSRALGKAEHAKPQVPLLVSGLGQKAIACRLVQGAVLAEGGAQEAADANALRRSRRGRRAQDGGQTGSRPLQDVHQDVAARIDTKLA